MIRVLAPLFISLPLFSALPTQQEALEMAFPGAAFTRREHYLNAVQAQSARDMSGTELPGLWWIAYEARVNGQLVGVAFFDTHRVRTLNETALIAVSAEGVLRRVEIVAFREPPEYMAKEAWIRQFPGRRLDGDLSLKKGIRPLSGATLTANALTDASRRALALWKILYGK